VSLLNKGIRLKKHGVPYKRKGPVAALSKRFILL